VTLIILSSFLLVFTACGLNFAFGVYQALYETYVPLPTSPFYRATPASIDLIGTLAISMMTIFAPFASAWIKSYSPRTITLLGGVIFALANVLASFGRRLWHFQLFQGFLLGVGTCLTYIPAVTVAPGWLEKNRALGMGIVLSGTGVGGVAWAPILSALNGSIGFRNSLRLTGGVSFIIITASALLLEWDPDSARRNAVELGSTHRTWTNRLGRVPLVDWQVARSRKFLAQALGGILQAAAYYTPVYFFASYARTLGYSSASGANFIALSNASNAIGKVIIGYLADRVGRLNALFGCTLISAISALALWTPSTLSEGGGGGRALFIAFAILYGLFASAYVSLFPAALIELFGIQHFASVNGLLYMLRGFASLVGTPVAGALVRSGSEGGVPGSYEKTSVMVGVLFCGASLAVLWARWEAGLRGQFRWKM